MTESLRSFNVVISKGSSSCYVGFCSELERTHLAEIEELQKMLEAQADIIENFIFDLSKLTFINQKCYRPIAMAQHCVRVKKGVVVAVIPPIPELKKLLLDEGLIRPKEICAQLNNVGVFIKEFRNKMNNKN